MAKLQKPGFKFRKAVDSLLYANSTYLAMVMARDKLLGFFATPEKANTYVEAAGCGTTVECNIQFKEALARMKAADKLADTSMVSDYECNKELAEATKLAAKHQRDAMSRASGNWNGRPPEWLVKMAEQFKEEDGADY